MSTFNWVNLLAIIIKWDFERRWRIESCSFSIVKRIGKTFVDFHHTWIRINQYNNIRKLDYFTQVTRKFRSKEIKTILVCLVYKSNRFQFRSFLVYQVVNIHYNVWHRVELHRNYRSIQSMIQVQENIMNISSNL